MAPRESHSKRTTSANKALPYSIVRAAAAELCALVETGDADDWVLDLAWLGLERPNPEPRDDGKERLTVWLSREESTALREYIDGDDASDVDVERGAKKIADALEGSDNSAKQQHAGRHDNEKRQGDRRGAKRRKQRAVTHQSKTSEQVK